MIVFDLQCSKGHIFEEWFSSTSDFDARMKKGDLACPTCGDKKLTKSLSAPAVATGSKSTPAPAPASPCATGGCGGGMCPWG